MALWAAISSKAEGAMGLASVMQTALSGMNAATSMIDVVANNLANSQTDGSPQRRQQRRQGGRAWPHDA